MKSSKVLLIVVILSLTLASVYSDDCGPHEYFNECGPMFEVICAKREMIYGPNNGCVPGCYCEQGFIREFQGGSCITDWECEERFPSTGDCPTGSDSSGDCGPNEYYGECGPSKEEYCFAPKQEIIGNCTAGCFCEQGYIRKLKGGECMLKEYCPAFLPVK